MRIDLDAFLRTNKQDSGETPKFGLLDKAVDYARKNYSESGHSSVNMAATTFGKSKPDVRDVAEQIDKTVPSSLEFAPAFDGSGDKAQEDGKIETIEAGDGVGPLQGQDWENYRNKLGQRESGNDYSKVNSIGFCGRWQMGAAALQDLGYVKSGWGTRSLINKEAWTGKDGINSRDAFLGNTKVQDSAFRKYTQANYKGLLRLKVIDKGTPKDQVAGFLAAAHLKGTGGARDFKNGKDNSDAYGTSTSEYYRMFADGALSDQTGVGAARSTGSPQEMLVNSKVQPDAAAFSFPSSPAAPKYPYNTIREYEAGHFKEYDSTPGFERIQERHKTGTGYEVLPDGSERVIVVGTRYTAIMGSDHILINGQCQIIVNGDCGLRVNGNMNHSVSNDYNLHVGGNMNVTVGGNSYKNTNGGEALVVQGDLATTVQGFLNVSADGDALVQGASVNLAARDGNFNLAASKDINIATPSNVLLTASGNVSMASKGNFAASSEGTMNVLGEGATTVASTGAKTTITGSSETVVHSGGSVKLHGSAVNATPKVDRAQWADTGGIVQVASALGGGPPPPPSPQGSSGAGSSAADQKENTKNTDKKKIDKAMETFNPFDASKTQGHGGGTSGELHGYDKGFQYEA